LEELSWKNEESCGGELFLSYKFSFSIVNWQQFVQQIIDEKCTTCRAIIKQNEA
jgi:hypothetical protein